MNDITKAASSKVVNSANGFFSKIFGPSLEHLGQILAGPLKERAFKNQLDVFEKVQRICKDRKVKIKPANMKILLPYLEGTAVEEDKSLQEIWAKLFVNYIDADKQLKITVYPEILKQLSSNDVKLLERCYNENILISKYAVNSAEREIQEEEMSNILRLGLVTIQNPDSIVIGKLFTAYVITLFGKGFVKACQL